VVLEIYDPRTSGLITRWDVDIIYDHGADGTLWADGDAIRYHILKAGAVPSSCKYAVILQTSPGRAEVDGFAVVTLRSVDGLNRHSIGATVGGNGIGTTTSYWGK